MKRSEMKDLVVSLQTLWVLLVAYGTQMTQVY